MKKIGSLNLIFLATFLVSLLVYFFLEPIEGPFSYPGAFYLLTAFLPFLLVAIIFRNNNLDSAEKKSLLILLLAYTGTFIGEAVWFYYENFTETFPFPSLADVFFISFYPLFFYFLIRQLRLSGINVNKEVSAQDFTLFLLAAFLAIVVAYFGIYLAIDSEATLLENLFGVIYGLADLLLIALAILVLKMALSYKERRISYIWGTLFLGLMSLLAADVLFAIFTDSYENGNFFFYILIDQLWIVHFLFFAYSAELMRKSGCKSFK